MNANNCLGTMMKCDTFSCRWQQSPLAFLFLRAKTKMPNLCIAILPAELLYVWTVYKPSILPSLSIRMSSWFLVMNSGIQWQWFDGLMEQIHRSCFEHKYKRHKELEDLLLSLHFIYWSSMAAHVHHPYWAALCAANQ